MVKKIRSVRSKDEELKNISICELFYKVAMDIAWPFLKHKQDTKYILVVVNHYFKWNEAKVVPNHGTKITVKFFEDE
jgi:serine kinase of HPr protein (carbohydrate metabolism regulator)